MQGWTTFVRGSLEETAVRPTSQMQLMGLTQRVRCIVFASGASCGMSFPGEGSWRRVGKGEDNVKWLMSLFKCESAQVANDFVLAGSVTEVRRLSAILGFRAKL